LLPAQSPESEFTDSRAIPICCPRRRLVALRRNGAGEQRNGDASDSVSAESFLHSGKEQ